MSPPFFSGIPKGSADVMRTLGISLASRSAWVRSGARPQEQQLMPACLFKCPLLLLGLKALKRGYIALL